MKRFVFRFFLTVCVLLVCQGCKKPTFELSVKLQPEIMKSYKVLYFASSSKQEFFIEQDLLLENGEGNLICHTKNPTIVMIFNGASESPAICLYAEKGEKLEITGTTADPATWTVAGNDINRRWSDWRNENPGFSHNVEVCNKAVKKYVLSHKDDLLSALLLLCNYTRAGNDAEFHRLWLSLNPKLRKDKIIAAIGRADMMSEPETRSFQKLQLRTYENGCDFIQFNQKPSIIYFWNNGDTSRRMMIDTLRNLSKTYPDSMSRNIIDICFETDSLSWVAPLRADSLRHTIRGWMPLGMTDNWALQARPEGSGSFLVIDKNGKDVYCGSDVEKASRKFRNLMKKP